MVTKCIYLEKLENSNSSQRFRKFINRYKRIGYNLDIMRQTAYMNIAINPIKVDIYAFLFNCMAAVQASDSATASTKSFHKYLPGLYKLSWVRGPECFRQHLSTFIKKLTIEFRWHFIDFSV